VGATNLGGVILTHDYGQQLQGVPLPKVNPRWGCSGARGRLWPGSARFMGPPFRGCAQSQYLFCLLLQRQEVEFAQHFPTQLLLRYGLACCPRIGAQRGLVDRTSRGGGPTLVLVGDTARIFRFRW
jgi:hypothetical protein